MCLREMSDGTGNGMGAFIDWVSVVMVLFTPTSWLNSCLLHNRIKNSVKLQSGEASFILLPF
jgi:hypothetical protein